MSWEAVSCSALLLQSCSFSQLSKVGVELQSVFQGWPAGSQSSSSVRLASGMLLLASQGHSRTPFRIGLLLPYVLEGTSLKSLLQLYPGPP